MLSLKAREPLRILDSLLQNAQTLALVTFLLFAQQIFTSFNQTTNQPITQHLERASSKSEAKPY